MAQAPSTTRDLLQAIQMDRGLDFFALAELLRVSDRDLHAMMWGSAVPDAGLATQWAPLLQIPETTWISLAARDDARAGHDLRRVQTIEVKAFHIHSERADALSHLKMAFSEYLPSMSPEDFCTFLQQCASRYDGVKIVLEKWENSPLPRATLSFLNPSPICVMRAEEFRRNPGLYPAGIRSVWRDLAYEILKVGYSAKLYSGPQRGAHKRREWILLACDSPHRTTYHFPKPIMPTMQPGESSFIRKT